MITELEIKNFKGINEISLKGLSRFNVIIGKNDSGKSTILESIFAFKAALVDPAQSFRIILRNNFREQNARELWYNYQTSSDPTVKLTIENIENKLSFHSDFTSQSIDVNFIIDGKTGHLKLNSFLNNVSSNNNIQPSTLHQPIRDALYSMEFFDTTTGRNTIMWEQTEKKLPLDKDDYDPLVTQLKLADYMSGQRRLALNKNNVDFFIDGFGEGHRSGLGIFSIAKRIRNSVLLVEEIETHQHPSSLKKITDRLIQICKENNNQVFFTTHSPEVLRILSAEHECRFYHLGREADDVSIYPIDHDDLNMLRDIGWYVGNFLNYEKFVIVEGLIDQIVIRNAFVRINNIWPEEMGITFISAGGNTDKQDELLRALSYHNRKIFVQRDLDDKKINQITQSITDSFVSRLQGDGYTLEAVSKTEYQMKHKSGITKKLVNSNIIVTGVPEKLPDIQRYAIEDYLLLILNNDQKLLDSISNGKPLPALNGLKSKTILEDMFGVYDTTIAEKIILNCSRESIPKELEAIVEKITKT